MAIDGFHVSGPALVYVGTGVAGASVLLGYTQDGVDVSLTHNTDEIMTDIFGPRTPHDMQDMGMLADISASIIASDRAVLDSIYDRGDKIISGTLNTPGLVLGSGNYGFTVGITSPLDRPYFFFRCFWKPSARVKLGTKASPVQLSFTALPMANYQTVVGKSAPLYSRAVF